MVTVSSNGPIWTFDLGDDENRFSPDWLSTVEGALGELEASSDPAVLITTGSGKYYSNGLDLEWIGQNFDQLDNYVARVQALFARVLTRPVPTIAAGMVQDLAGKDRNTLGTIKARLCADAVAALTTPAGVA